MNCKKIKKYISAYIDYELDAVNTKLLKEHISVCEKCRSEYDYLVNLNENMPKLNMEVPENFKYRLLSRIKKEKRKVREIKRRFLLVPAYAAASLLLIIFTFSGTFLYAYNSTVKDPSGLKEMSDHYIKDTVLNAGLTPLACVKFLNNSRDCVKKECEVISKECCPGGNNEK